MGTPDFAVPSLDILSRTRHRVVGVVTQPDKPKGRGRKLSPPPVKLRALEKGYPVFQPASVRDDLFYETVKSLSPDILVVIAYGKILPKKILLLPPLGAINMHASLLPKYRGPAPIQWVIINRETETGVTAMQMDQGLDTGNILLAEKTPVHEAETAGGLHDRLSEISASLLVETLDLISKNTLRPVPQEPEKATHAPMLQKKDGRIDWGLPAMDIEAFVRGMSPWPGAFTFLDTQRLKVLKTRIVSLETEENIPPGTVLPGFPDELRVATGKGALVILEIQGASGKRLSAEDYLRGHPIPPGKRLG